MKKIKLLTGSFITTLVLIVSLTLTNGIKANTTARFEVQGYENSLNGISESLLRTATSIEFNDGEGLIIGTGERFEFVYGRDDFNFIANENFEFIYWGSDVFSQFSWNSQSQEFEYENGSFTNGTVEIRALDSRPAITGQENFVTSVDDAKPVSFFQSFLTAIDETDGEVPVYVKTDNYTANKSVLGTHKVIFGAKDNSGNEAILEVYIRVVDITKPIINGNASVVKIGYKEVWNITNFKSTLNVSDNYDTLTNADITVKTDGYTANKSKLGTYNVVYAVKDKSGNEGTFTKPVQVYDNVRPTFSGPLTIATSNTTILTESDVRAQITANDEIDGNLTQKIKLVEDNFTGKGNKVGSYTIKYSVTDNAGNTEEFTVTIQRSDKLPPVIWIQDGVSIKTTSTTPLTFEQIIAILQATGQVSSSTTTTFRNEYDEYTGNENTPGIYAMSIRARSVDGNESLHNMSITVLDDTNEDDITKTPGADFVTWIKENPALVTVGIVAVIGIGYFVFRKKK